MKQEFFERLYRDRKFCNSLGQVMLAASKLESILRKFLNNHGHPISEKRATLGNLVIILKDNGYLSKNAEINFEDLKLQRNYLSHSLYDLFDENIPETLLPRENLVAEDVHYFAEKAAQTAENFCAIANIIMENIDQGRRAPKKEKGTLLL
jgi:hypothetical protein